MTRDNRLQVLPTLQVCTYPTYLYTVVVIYRPTLSIREVFTSCPQQRIYIDYYYGVNWAFIFFTKQGVGY